MSCGYTGPHFGATYDDAICCDGDLWDLDSCDEPGGPLFSGGDIPCPQCNTMEYVRWHCVVPSGNSRQRRKDYRIRARLIRSML